MDFIDEDLNSDAYRFAFILSLKEHLKIHVEKTKLKDGLRDHDGMEQDDLLSIQTKEKIHQMEIVLDYVLNKVLRFYLNNDIQLSKNGGFPQKALSNNLSKLVLGPNVDDYSVPPTINTNILLMRSNRKTQGMNYSVNRQDQLGEFLYCVLKNSFEFYHETLSDTKVRASPFLSSFVAEFLRHLLTHHEHLFERDDKQFLLLRINSVVQDLEYDAGGYENSSEQLEKLYKLFERFLKTHLELSLCKSPALDNSKELVFKLREQGNALMSNSAYAQAIRVYTDAINHCHSSAINNLPQLLTNRAIAFIGLTCFPEAIDDLNQALLLDIASIPAWVQLGYAQLYKGNSLVALQCYSTVLKCCTGEVLPLNFDYSDDTACAEYKQNKIQTTLPQFVEQLLKSTQLTETRAHQQRLSEPAIKDVVASIKKSLDILKVGALPDDVQCYSYPPNNNEFNSFRSIAERVNSSRPGILSHEVSQGVIAGTDNNDNNNEGGRRPPMIAIETRLGTPTTAATHANAGNDERQPPRVRDMFNELGGLMERQNENREEEGRRDEGREQNNVERTENNSERRENEGRTENNSETTQSSTNNTNNPETNPNQTNTRENPVRDVLRGLLPNYMSDGINNIITHSFGGNGEVVFSSGNVNGQPFGGRPPYNRNSSDQNNQQNQQNQHNQSDDMPQEDLD